MKEMFILQFLVHTEKTAVLETGEVGEVLLMLKDPDVMNRQDPNHLIILFKLRTGASAAAD